jgi:rhamnose transport system permease protein
MKQPFRHWHEVVLAGLLTALLGWARVVEPQFVSLSSQIELSAHVWELALLAMPMTLIIITAGIDLSIGSALALCAVVLGLTYERGVSPAMGAVLAVAAGLMAGALNGVFVTKVNVPPLIVTLATLAVFRGIAEGISLGRPISGFPDGFAVISRGSLLGVPLPCLLVLAAAGIAGVVLVKTPTGRFLYAIGHNETATRFSGVAVDRIKFWLYTASGGAAGLAAVLLVARRNTAKADLGAGMELDVITAVVLGGTSIFGGRGNIVGTLLGVLLIHETREFVSWHWNQAEMNLIVIGFVLLASGLSYQLFSRPLVRS